MLFEHTFDLPVPIPPHIEIHPTHLTHAAAYTDGIKCIWIDRTLTRIEARCAITHELMHIARGDTCATSKRERRARRATALALLPRIPHGIKDMPLQTVADEHNVTPAVLTDRILIERGEL
ncbi:ImmA/IrrE family metallo-endopeptidase [Rothia amarae]|uniref:ImmA/IrrE family metallo-endopeptidase n=1 Tax=Rothia amarae TaxID=169480 RepID=UPI0031D109E0